MRQMLPIDRTLLLVLLVGLLPLTALAQVENTDTGDTFSAIQTAINDSDTDAGDVIEVTSDISEGLITINKEIVLDGNGYVLSSNSSSYGIRIESSSVTIRDLTVDGAGSFGIHQKPKTSGLSIENTTVRNGEKSGFALNCSDGATLTDIQSLDNNGNGVSLTGMSNVTIDGITTSGNSFTTFSAGIGIFTNTSGDEACDQSLTDGVTLQGSVSINEPVKVYEQPGSGTITNLTLPASLSHFSGVVGTENRFYYESASAATDAAVQSIQNDPSQKPVTFVKSRTSPKFFVADGMSIQAAVDAASSSATVEVSDGTYAESVTVDTDQLNLKGPNAGTPGDGSRDSEATIEGQVVISASGIVLDGFDVTPGSVSSNSTGEALRIGGTPNNVTVKNNIVRDANGDNLPTWEGLDGIVAFGGEAGTPIDGVTISKNLVKNLDGRDTKGGAAGISIQGNVQNATVTDNRVTSIGQQSTAWAFGITVRGTENHEETPSDVNVKDNDVSSVLSNPSTSTVGVGFGFEGGDVNSVTVENNSFSNTALQVEDKTLDVGPGLNLDDIINQNNNTFDRAVTIRNSNGNVKDEGGVQRIYSPISPAVENADPGETVQVNDGNYDEVVTVGKRLTVQDASTPTVNAFDVAADNVTIDGFKITGGTVGGETAGIVVQSNTSGHTFSDNNLMGDSGEGVSIKSSVDDTQIKKNNISGWDTGIIAAGQSGSVDVDENCITGNEVGISNGSFFDIDASGNWWGAPDGPSGEYPGSGDKVTGPTGNVTVNFSTEPVDACLSNNDGQIPQPKGSNPTAECQAVTDDSQNLGALEPFAKYEEGEGFVDNLPGNSDISFTPVPSSANAPTVPEGIWDSSTEIAAFLIKQSTNIYYWENPGTTLNYVNPEDEFSHITFCVREDQECDTPALAGDDDVDKENGTVSNTITDDDGINTFTFTKLEGLKVVSDFPSDFSKNGSKDEAGVTWTWEGNGDPPTSVDFTLGATKSTVSYFVEVTDACPGGANTLELDPRYEFEFGADIAQPRLAGSAPNPFSGQTTVEFALPKETRVTVAIYDMLGRKVATLVDGTRRAGTHTLTWNGRTESGQALSSGVYLMRMRADGQSETQRVTVVR